MSNTSERPLGEKVDPTPAPWPSKEIELKGKHVTLAPISPSHASQLFPLVGGEANAYLWDYMPYDPCPPNEAFLKEDLAKKSASNDPVFYTILKHLPDGTKAPVGWASYLRIDARNRVIEVGHLMFSSALQRSVAATEAMYLVAKYAFELGYRRYEWKCHNLNAPSKRAALRLGLLFAPKREIGGTHVCCC